MSETPNTNADDEQPTNDTASGRTFTDADGNEISMDTRTLVESFIEDHDCTDRQQALILLEEQGELAEAVLRDDEQALREEIGDVLFVLRGFLAAYDTSLESAFQAFFDDAVGFADDEIAADVVQRHAEDPADDDLMYVSSLADAVAEIVYSVLPTGDVRMSPVGEALLVTHSLAAAHNINGDTCAYVTAVQNSLKDGSTDGEKVTQSTDGETDSDYEYTLDEFDK